ncbi:hypothetical protein [Pantoea phytobeneficialis]|uniref:Uncharacterized protein n=1 Tax=Pantoea phytobeneficialis TaxID=2052056 RepID=A0ABT8XRC4_9GAMM|nr:hypothetical protein [Pantoea phytobeneficialis]MDO6406003.1 hypothetical protein [Pantoea phytobeneficialis]
MEKIFAMYNNHSVRKAKQPTTGTSLLNHSLGLAEAREDRKKLFSGEQKREADHLSGEILVKCCSLKCKKGRENPGHVLTLRLIHQQTQHTTQRFCRAPQ